MKMYDVGKKRGRQKERETEKEGTRDENRSAKIHGAERDGGSSSLALGTERG